MERCPTCNAKYRGKKLCHRCKTDLGALVDIETKAGLHQQKALSAFASNDFNQMFFHAKRAFSLYRSPASVRILACAALLTNKFDLAISLWARQDIETKKRNYSEKNKPSLTMASFSK